MNTQNAETRLATYGTLAPGRPNHHQLAELEGNWTRGLVKGTLKQAGWGAEQGYPGIVLDDDGQEVEVHIFHSADLPNHWPRLDAFEGEGYRRVSVDVRTGAGVVAAFIYALAG